MSLIQHKITLDVKTFRSVEPIMLFTDSSSAYSIIVKITDGGKEVDLSEYDTFKMEIEGTQTTNFPEGTVENNRIVFELSNTMINEGWTVCDVIMMSGSTLVKTQVFQIYKQIFNAVQVDETPFAQISQSDLQRLLNMSTSLSGADFSALNNITSSDVARLKGMTQSEIDQWDSAITDVEDFRDATYYNLVPTSDETPQSGKKYYYRSGNSWIPLRDGYSFVSGTTYYEAGKSYINNNKLYIYPSVQEIKFDGYDVLNHDTGVAEIDTYDMISRFVFQARNDFGDEGSYFDTWGSPVDSEHLPNNPIIIPINTGIEKIIINGGDPMNAVLGEDEWGNPRFVVEFNAVERVKLNGTTLDTPKPNINAVTGVIVDNTNIDATNTNPRVELAGGNGISLTPDTSNNQNKVTIAVNTSDSNFSVPISKVSAPNNTDEGSLVVYSNGGFEAQDWATALGLSVSESGNTVSITQGSRTVAIQSSDFETVSSIADTSNLLFLTANDSRQKISWTNLLSLFETYFMGRHKTVYFEKTIAGDTWVGDTATVTLNSTDFGNTGITTAVMTGDHTHAHIHPEPDSLYEFANYGIYCSAISASNGDTVLTFKRNTTLDGGVMPSVNITIEVRLDVEDT